MLLWANSIGIATLATYTPTPTSTPFPIPTPVPVDTPAPTPTPEPVATLSTEDIIGNVLPSVVTVVNQQQSQSFASTGAPDEGRIVGSGFVIDDRGYIATNNHVVDHPGELRIILADGREVVAKLIAANPAEDLAILKIDLPNLVPIEWGDSTKVRPGQIVYAIGSPLGDFPGSVSFGIVSGLNRALEIDKYVIDGLIQTDAAINRGSSGGPLINPQGQVVGLNTFIIRESEERGVAEGIAFAIPAETAKGFLIPWVAAHTGESVPIPVSGESN
jgi:S1-C subfamily serine protease